MTFVKSKKEVKELAAPTDNALEKQHVAAEFIANARQAITERTPKAEEPKKEASRVAEAKLRPQNSNETWLKIYNKLWIIRNIWYLSIFLMGDILLLYQK